MVHPDAPGVVGDYVLAALRTGHYRMRGEYQVVQRSEWDRWLADEVARVR